jgi:hypothetical protein
MAASGALQWSDDATVNSETVRSEIVKSETAGDVTVRLWFSLIHLLQVLADLLFNHTIIVLSDMILCTACCLHLQSTAAHTHCRQC